MKCYIEINNIRVESKIFVAKFCCDYDKCKGACCNQPLSDVELLGGAVSDYDAAEILLHRKALSLLCDEDDQQVALEQPISKYDGQFYTTLKKDKCVFCSLQRETCMLKVAKEMRVADIDIPLSCQLYPLLWEIYPTFERLCIGDTFDKYCTYGYKKGTRENVFLLDFLRVPLIRGFGEDFYAKLKEIQKDFL